MTLQTISMCTFAMAVSTMAVVSCNEEEKAQIRVVRQELDNSITDQIGKAEVALELLRTELIHKKDNWAKIKTLCLTYERRAKQAAIEAENFEKQGKTAQAQAKRRIAERYAAQVEKMKQREVAIEARFKAFKEEYEEKKTTIAILKDEVASLKSLGDLSDDLNIESESEERLERARELTESLQQDVERASAIIDVNLEDI